MAAAENGGTTVAGDDGCEERSHVDIGVFSSGSLLLESACRSSSPADKAVTPVAAGCAGIECELPVAISAIDTHTNASHTPIGRAREKSPQLSQASEQLKNITTTTFEWLAQQLVEIFPTVHKDLLYIPHAASTSNSAVQNESGCLYWFYKEARKQYDLESAPRRRVMAARLFYQCIPGGQEGSMIANTDIYISYRLPNIYPEFLSHEVCVVIAVEEEWVPFVIYADFECVLKPVAEAKAYSVHEAFSCGLYLKCNFDDELSEYRCYRKVNDNDMSPSEWFAQNLQDIAHKVLEFFDNPKPMYFTSVEKVKFEKAETCHICKQGFTEKDNKVRDHSHFTGEYRGAAHSKCNINYRDVRFVPVIFHNLSGYDSHLFIREVATGFPGRVWVLPQTKERYFSFVKFMEDKRLSFCFIDSSKFMASSLDNLASYLKQQPTLRKVFGQDYDDAQIKLLTKKGVFPYEYISSLEKLQETALPPPEQFYSSLTDSDFLPKITRMRRKCRTPLKFLI
ncbi:unnamed protein product [Trichogramma brassicae]|uniref:DNA-directed DNA polymerase n=1 Tax=Trichogramma brassicae TaxID=86971 RepID=A0A6H5J6G8_9HYME|nr:unnamed protein product [Trichogramma brassicae]